MAAQQNGRAFALLLTALCALRSVYAGKEKTFPMTLGDPITEYTPLEPGDKHIWTLDNSIVQKHPRCGNADSYLVIEWWATGMSLPDHLHKAGILPQVGETFLLAGKDKPPVANIFGEFLVYQPLGTTYVDKVAPKVRSAFQRAIIPLRHAVLEDTKTWQVLLVNLNANIDTIIPSYTLQATCMPAAEVGCPRHTPESTKSCVGIRYSGDCVTHPDDPGHNMCACHAGTLGADCEEANNIASAATLSSYAKQDAAASAKAGAGIAAAAAGAGSAAAGASVSVTSASGTTASTVVPGAGTAQSGSSQQLHPAVAAAKAAADAAMAKAKAAASAAAGASALGAASAGSLGALSSSPAGAQPGVVQGTAPSVNGFFLPENKAQQQLPQASGSHTVVNVPHTETHARDDDFLTPAEVASGAQLPSALDQAHSSWKSLPGGLRAVIIAVGGSAGLALLVFVVRGMMDGGASAKRSGGSKSGARANGQDSGDEWSSVNANGTLRQRQAANGKHQRSSSGGNYGNADFGVGAVSAVRDFFTHRVAATLARLGGWGTYSAVRSPRTSVRSDDGL